MPGTQSSPNRSRRSFIRSGAVFASALLAAPYVRAADKAGSRPVVGAGEHTYEWWDNWPEPPPGMVWGDTHGLCQDAAGYIYVAHTVNSSSMRPEAIVVFDPDGKFVRAFGAEFRGGAHGLDLRMEGGREFLYVTDTVRSLVAKLTLTGETVWSRGYPTEDPFYAAGPKRFVPTNVAFAPDGGYYVGDGYGSSRMLRYDAAGRFLGEIARSGTGDGELKSPHGQWVDTRGRDPVLVIADRGNRRLQTFTLEGRHLRTIQHGEDLRMPCHFHTRGKLMVCPDLDSQVCLLDPEYRVIARLGDGKAHNGDVGSRRTQRRTEFTPGEFIAPHDAIFLQSGDILVGEYLPIGRLTRLRKVT